MKPISFRALLITSLLVASSCGLPCRGVVEARELDVNCDPIADFRGEIHFDNEETFRTFLVRECLPNATAEAEADRIVGDVDFGTEGVFIASGASNLSSRCILERRFAGCEVCDDGLKVSFDDIDSDPSSGCPVANWTIGIALPRADLRAALEAGDAVDSSR